MPELRLQIEAVTQEVIRRMKNNSPCGVEKMNKEGFITVPVDYDVDEAFSGGPLQLWGRSLAELASQLVEGRIDHATEFLEIHSFLKDPIGGLKRSSDEELGLFYRLLDAFRASYHGNTLSLDDWQRVIAQTSQESSYLGSPYI